MQDVLGLFGHFPVLAQGWPAPEGSWSTGGNRCALAAWVLEGVGVELGNASSSSPHRARPLLPTQALFSFPHSIVLRHRCIDSFSWCFNTCEIVSRFQQHHHQQQTHYQKNSRLLCDSLYLKNLSYWSYTSMCLLLRLLCPLLQFGVAPSPGAEQPALRKCLQRSSLPPFLGCFRQQHLPAFVTTAVGV